MYTYSCDMAHSVVGFRSGPGAVVAQWDRHTIVIGPDKDYISYPLPHII